jgi:hypothetical protein
MSPVNYSCSPNTETATHSMETGRKSLRLRLRPIAFFFLGLYVYFCSQ